MKAVLNTTNNTIMVGPLSDAEFELAQGLTAANAKFFYDGATSITPTAVAFIQSPLGNFLELTATGLTAIVGFQEIVQSLDLAILRQGSTPYLFSLAHFNDNANPSTNPALRAQQMATYASS